jgi:hypothetical protein
LFTVSLTLFTVHSIAVTIKITSTGNSGHIEQIADTTKIEDRTERKKLKRTARKKAAPKAKRTTPRGSNKKKIKKLARGVSKR